MLLVAVAVTIPAGAQIIKRKNLVDINRDSIEHVIIDGDTVPVILPEKNYGRFDRGLFNYIFIPKGKWGFGITANYGELQTEDIQVLSILKNVDFNGKMYSIKPYVSYFVRSNQSVGLKFDYTAVSPTLAALQWISTVTLISISAISAIISRVFLLQHSTVRT